MLARLTLIATLFITTLFGTLNAANADDLQTAVRNHVERVRDFDARRAMLERWQRERLKGAALAAALREQLEKERERNRARFALTRQKEDPLADAKRDAIYQAVLLKRERENDLRRAAYVKERERIERALARLRQIDPMVEYDLQTVP